MALLWGCGVSMVCMYEDGGYGLGMGWGLCVGEAGKWGGWWSRELTVGNLMDL